MVTSDTNQTKLNAINDLKPNLERGLSIFLESPEINPPTLDLNNSTETTLDLINILGQQKSTPAPTFAQLEPVPTMTVIPQVHVENNFNTFGMSECSMDSLSSSYTSSSDHKRKLDSDVDIKPTTSKRGRKPSNVTTSGSKFGKQEVKKGDKTTTTVCFGNKRVEVDTDEYRKRRENNNEAVKRCREKAEKEQQEREARMKKLQEENQKLNDKVASMNKEMEVLKNIILSMKPDLPDNIKDLMNNI